MQKCKKQENILYLPLKKKWFDMIKSGIKKEEYREINKYWCRRLYECYTDKPGHYGQCQTFNQPTDRYEFSCPCHECDMGRLKNFDKVVFTLGYPKADDKERHIEFDNPVITIGKGKPEWGADEGKDYFVIILS